jgi:hypothetical protein
MGRAPKLQPRRPLACPNPCPPPPPPLAPAPAPCSYDDIKKEACFILGLLAVKPEYQAQISDAGALPGLVALLRAHKPTAVTRVVPGSGGVARRAADAITNLAHENVEIKVGAGRGGGASGRRGPLCFWAKGFDPGGPCTASRWGAAVACWPHSRARPAHSRAPPPPP